MVASFMAKPLWKTAFRSVLGSSALEKKLQV